MLSYFYNLYLLSLLFFIIASEDISNPTPDAAEVKEEGSKTASSENPIVPETKVEEKKPEETPKQVEEKKPEEKKPEETPKAIEEKKPEVKKPATPVKKPVGRRPFFFRPPPVRKPIPKRKRLR